MTQAHLQQPLRLLSIATPKISHSVLAAVFNQCFGATYNVRCFGGFPEPEYRCSEQTRGVAELRYTDDFAASALHEIAHWCIAGERRLALPDFGYGYLPPPRDSTAQQRFFALELKVQVLEAWFASGTGVRFVASADNFECSDAALTTFRQQIAERLRTWTTQDVPQRAQIYAAALVAAGLGVWPPVAKHGAQSLVQTHA